MKSESGMTLITVVIMVIIVGVISAVSVITSRTIFSESKEEVLKQNRFAVESVVSKYSAKAATSGVLTPANEKLPGIQNPSFEYKCVNGSGDEESENRNIGEDWYLLLREDLESIGISYAEENYLVNYKKNIVIPLSETENIFSLVEFYEAK